MSLVLKTLGGDETLDTRSFGVWFLALAFGLDFTANNEFANLCDDCISITCTVVFV